MLRIFRKNNSEEPDDILIVKYRQTGDSASLAVLFQRYSGFVFAVSMKYLRDREKSKDMTMQVFEKLVNDLTRFEVQNFKPWVHTVTRNLCLMYLRKEQSKGLKMGALRKEETPLMENLPFSHPEEEDLTDLNISRLGDAMGSLPETQKLCVDMFYLKDKSYAEIAEETGFTLNEVKSYIQNGKRNLKIYLTRNVR